MHFPLGKGAAFPYWCRWITVCTTYKEANILSEVDSDIPVLTSSEKGEEKHVAKIKRIKQTPKLLRVCITVSKSENHKFKGMHQISMKKYADTRLLTNVMLLRRWV